MQITPNDLVLYFGLLLTFLNILERVSILKDKASTPHKEHEQRISHLEDEIDKIHEYIDDNNSRIENLEKGGRVLLRSLGALLSHGIDGNNVAEMRAAREELNDYLIGR